jgi:hypothetical protein
METIGSIATIALAIVGLSGIWSTVMAAIATIVVGAAFLSEGGAIGASALARSSNFETVDLEASTAPSGAFLGGVGGIILGILALLGIVAPTLLAVALIVFGATFLVSSVSMGGMWSTGGQVMGGLAAIVLGILAVCGVSELVLILVGLLVLGGTGLFAGSLLGVRAMPSASNG